MVVRPNQVQTNTLLLFRVKVGTIFYVCLTIHSMLPPLLALTLLQHIIFKKKIPLSK